MALKLDISKAYDRIEWSFLEQMLRGLGFAEEWIHWIMMCVTTVSYSFKLNGETVGFVQPKRGIRQGDPLSTFLFVLCAEGLSALFDSWEAQGRIQGIKVCKEAPSVPHLFFADDSFIFVRSSLQECLQVKELLRSYEQTSGQAVNLTKSSVAFSNNLTEFDVQLLADCLGMEMVDFHERYLGLPVLVGRSKKATFAYIKDRLWEEVEWMARLFVE